MVWLPCRTARLLNQKFGSRKTGIVWLPRRIIRFSNFDFEVTAGTKSLTAVSNQPVVKQPKRTIDSVTGLATASNSGIPVSTTQDGVSCPVADLRRREFLPQRQYSLL